MGAQIPPWISGQEGMEFLSPEGGEEWGCSGKGDFWGDFTEDSLEELWDRGVGDRTQGMGSPCQGQEGWKIGKDFLPEEGWD